MDALSPLSQSSIQQLLQHRLNDAHHVSVNDTSAFGIFHGAKSVNNSMNCFHKDSKPSLNLAGKVVSANLLVVHHSIVKGLVIIQHSLPCCRRFDSGNILGQQQAKVGIMELILPQTRLLEPSSDRLTPPKP